MIKAKKPYVLKLLGIISKARKDINEKMEPKRLALHSF
jgi:hypothetical protein